MTSRNIAKRLIVKECGSFLTVVLAMIVQTLFKSLIDSSNMIYVCIINILMPIIFFLFYKINKFFKASAILRLVASAFAIATNIIDSFCENQYIYIVLLSLSQIISIAIAVCFIKGIIDIFKGYNEEKLCKKWDFILYAMMVYMVPKSVSEVMTALNLENPNMQLITMTLSFAVVLIGIFAITFSFIYTIKSIVYLWNKEK